jgi:hypothetical protein
MIRTDLRLDLKDSGTLWSDPELNRAYEKAVSDLSRFLPLEKVYEETLDFDITDESFTTPATTNLTAICSAVDINVAAGSTLTISGQPDVPRVLTLTITDANSSTYGATFTVRGTDKDGLALTEQFHYNRGMSKTLTGKKEFKTVYEVELESDSGSGAGDTLSVGYSTTYTAWVYLTYRPLEESNHETVTNAAGTTTYTRDTDYIMDYYNGRIKLLSGGSMAASTAYLIDYKKDNISINLSSIPDMVRVMRVEYPVGDVPQSFVPTDSFSNNKVIYLTGLAGDQESQDIMSDKYHIRVYYGAEHQSALDDAPGTIPDFLDNTVLMASAAYALFIYAEKQEHAAATALASATTALAAATTNQTDIDTAFTNMKKYLDNNTSSDAAGMLSGMSTDLTAFDTAIADATTVLDNNSGADAKELLKDITDDAANLRTAIETAVDAIATALGAVVTTDIASANTAGALMDEPAVLAQTAITAGTALHNTVNVGGEQQEVPLAYDKDAEMQLGVSQAYGQQQQGYIQTANARTNAAMGYMQEAAQRLSNLRTYIEQSTAYTAIGNAFISQATAIVNKLSIYIAKADQYISLAQAFANQATTLIEQNKVYELSAQDYITQAQQFMLLADKFRLEAQDRRDEVWSIWRDKNQFIGDSATGSVRQSAAFSNG